MQALIREHLFSVSWANPDPSLKKMKYQPGAAEKTSPAALFLLNHQIIQVFFASNMHYSANYG